MTLQIGIAFASTVQDYVRASLGCLFSHSVSISKEMKITKHSLNSYKQLKKNLYFVFYSQENFFYCRIFGWIY